MAVQSRSINLPVFDVNAAVKDPAMIESLKIVRPKSKEERMQEIRSKDREHWFKLITSGILFLTAIAVVAVGIIICVEIIRNPSSTPDDKKWATTVLFAVITSLVGFLVGKGTDSKSTDKD